jgi:isoleucyl-tRNA synthetase
MFKIEANYDFINSEKEVLRYWEEAHCFEKLLKKNAQGPKYRFIDGPITANNPMGIHHVWGRTLKDTFLRYKAMNGFTSHYRNGFDGQGLWVEVEVEKELGFQSKRDIEAYGLDRFTEACVARVRKYAQIITEQSKRLGQWMDWDNSYYTYTDENITGIWAVLKKCHERGWLKQIYRPMPWCGRCGTSLSEHEMGGSYREVEHQAVFVRLPLKTGNANILVWTTTPWTLSSNTALAVHPELDYVKVELKGEEKPLILSKEVYRQRFSKEGIRILETLKGRDLAGWEYETMFPELPRQKSVRHRIVLWDEVSSEEGSGVVHIAPGCGAEDYELGLREHLDIIMPIDENANFFADFAFLAGKNAGEVNKLIFEHLQAQGKLFLVHQITHSYPVCWRCKKEVVFRLEKAWAIDVEELREPLLRNARRVKWYPEYQGKRMEDWLNNMSDWNISRKRFYGLPLPFYQCSCGHLTVIGSREELQAKAVHPELVSKLRELHRPWIDEIKIVCPQCGKEVERISEVGDVWLDAGIVPFSTLKYFSDRNYWRSYFPAEFVIEMKEQIRLWFYSLLFMSTVLEDCPPYEQVGTHGMVVTEEGTRFSKTGFMIRFEEAAEKIGADASRYIYLGTPLSTDVRFGFSLGDDARRRLLAFWNIIVFFNLYYDLDRPDMRKKVELKDHTDLWLESRIALFVQEAQSHYETYETSGIIKAFDKVVDDVSNWYIRINRKRFWKAEMNNDKIAAYQALYRAIKTLTQVMAPIIPFMTEWIWLSLIRKVEDTAESVHLTDFPKAQPANLSLLADQEQIREIINYALKLRNERNLKIKQPLSILYLCGFSGDLLGTYQEILKNEINVKEIILPENKTALCEEYLSLDFRKAGAVLKASVNQVKEMLAAVTRKEMSALVQSYKQGKPLKLGEFSLPGDLFHLNVRFPEHLAVLETEERLVALNTEINEDLYREGLYREILRQCQLFRKEAGFNVNERIQLALRTEEENLQCVIALYREKLETETLAKLQTQLDNPRLEKKIRLEEAEILIQLK